MSQRNCEINAAAANGGIQYRSGLLRFFLSENTAMRAGADPPRLDERKLLDKAQNPHAVASARRNATLYPRNGLVSPDAQT
jgi:hypothetical protein